MALQALKAYVGARQHSWIGRTMRLVARRAAFKTHGRMFERKGSALIAVAGKTTGLVGREILDHRGPDSAVRIVAIHAAHAAFRKLVVKRTLELRPDIQMTTAALRVDGIGLACYQSGGIVGVHLMAGRTRNLVLGVAAFQASDVCRLIQMTGETDFVGGRRGELSRIPNVIGRRPFCMGLSRTMAGFASASLPASLCVRLYLVMGTLGKTVENVFVTNLAGFRTRICGRLGGYLWKRSRTEKETEQN